ncbi:MAG TPA: hypothetical protein VHF69_14445 [Candidatus Synoicihabitans sp.]|nr:hypothetical protein [Candidatus Synoicihabitans sp.]
MNPTPTPSVSPLHLARPLALCLLALWFAAAVLAGAAGWLVSWPSFAVPALVWALTGVVTWSYFTRAEVRGWIEAIGLRRLIALHVIRFVGVAFLLLAAAGRLPRTWALGAGWGDIIVAALAAALLLVSAPRLPRLAYAWNWIGLVDLVFVIGGAGVLNFRTPEQLTEMTRLPMVLLPTFFVPLLLASHFIIFDLLRTARPPRASASAVDKGARRGG